MARSHDDYRTSKSSPSQLEKMLCFIEQHPELVRGKSGGRAKHQKLWYSLTTVLNDDLSGPSKHPLKWQKTWIDWKSNTKKKYMKIKNRAMSPDALTLGPKSLSKMEERLIAFLYPDSLEEDILLQEAGLLSAENEILLDVNGEREEQYIIIEDDIEIKNEEDAKRKEMPSTNQVHESPGTPQVDNFVEMCFEEDEKMDDGKERRKDLLERQLQLRERALRDKERRTDIFERAVRDKERRSEILERVLRDRERRTDLYARRMADSCRRTDAFCKTLSDMQKRTEVFKGASSAFISALRTCNGSLSLNKFTHR